METNWAADHLQTIRTLMERSAVYRRALAPIMLYVGAIGAVAALLAMGLHIDSDPAFVVFWLSTAVVAMSGSFFLVRRQAIRDSEPFWSPPTRRVTQAFLPPLVAGLLLGHSVIFFHDHSLTGHLGLNLSARWLPQAWIILYGCAFHSAGFFLPRGMRIFGWAFILAGCVLFHLDPPGRFTPAHYSHGLMGCFFGLLHLACGIYLYVTEKGKNAA